MGPEEEVVLIVDPAKQIVKSRKMLETEEVLKGLWDTLPRTAMLMEPTAESSAMDQQDFVGVPAQMAQRWRALGLDSLNQIVIWS